MAGFGQMSLTLKKVTADTLKGRNDSLYMKGNISINNQDFSTLISGGGEVDTTGLPVATQIAYFTAANKIGGSVDFKWETRNLDINYGTSNAIINRYVPALAGIRNTILGQETAHFISMGSNNLILGYGSGYYLTIGSTNIYAGMLAGHGNESGNNNIAIGDSSLRTSATGDNNIAVGSQSGRYVNGLSNRLYINSIKRTNVLGDTTQSIIYGLQDAAVSNQQLYFNANVNVTGDSAIFSGYIKADSLITLTQVYADYVFNKDYKIPSLKHDVDYAYEHNTLPKLAAKTGNIGSRLENVVETVERLYVQTFRNFRLIYFIIGLLVLWNIELTIKLRKK